MALTPQQIAELDIASTRVSRGSPGAATATNAGDIANLEYAKKLGYVYTPSAPSIPNAPATSPTPTTPAPVTPKDMGMTPEQINAMAQRDLNKTRYTNGFYDNMATNEKSLRDEYYQKALQAIAALEEQYKPVIRQENAAGEQRLGQTRAASSRAGIIGQDFGIQQQAKTEGYNTQQLKLIEAQKANEIAGIFDKFDSRAEARINSERNLAFKNREEQMTERTNMINDARTAFTSLAKKSSGAWDQMDGADKQEWLAQTGYSPEVAEIVYNDSKPTKEKIEWKQTNIGNTVVYSGIDPVSGQLKTLTYKLPEGASGLQIIDNVPYNKFKNEDGTFTLKKAAGFEEPKEGGYETLSEGQAVFDTKTGKLVYKNPKTYKASSGGGGGSDTGDEEDEEISEEGKAFLKDIKISRELLAKYGANKWGEAWDRIKDQYSDIPNETIDKALNKEKYYPRPDGTTPAEEPQKESWWNKLNPFD
jgi:hypothetical protein